MENLSKKFSAIAKIALVAAIIFGVMAFYKISSYANDEESYGSHINAYVGGDAYNYIINGTYFAGYSALCGACLICSCGSFAFSLYLKEKYSTSTQPSLPDATEDDELPDL